MDKKLEADLDVLRSATLQLLSMIEEANPQLNDQSTAYVRRAILIVASKKAQLIGDTLRDVCNQIDVE